jgi:hypothetical protein
MNHSICELPSAAHPKGKDSYRYELFSLQFNSFFKFHNYIEIYNVF